jgi:hypothetical protein
MKSIVVGRGNVAGSIFAMGTDLAHPLVPLGPIVDLSSHSRTLGNIPDRVLETTRDSLDAILR